MQVVHHCLPLRHHLYNPDTEKAGKCNPVMASQPVWRRVPPRLLNTSRPKISDWLGAFAAERAAGRLHTVAADA